MTAPKLYLIPGTGSDARLFAEQVERFPDAVIPAWLPPLRLKEPLAAYAKRLAERIDTSEPFVLGGVSLGGMLAQEMALTLKPLAVIMISTARSSKALPLSRRLTGRFTRALPDFAVKGMFSLTALGVKLFTPKHIKHRDLYAQMLQEMPPHLVRWQSGAATEWALKGELSMPVFHIHGAQDPLIPVKNVSPQQVVEKGGHLINITHAAEVNGFIAECLGKVEVTDSTRQAAG